MSKPTTLTFGEAAQAAKTGKKVARLGWNATGMFAYIVPAASTVPQTKIDIDYFGKESLVFYRTHWVLKTAQEDIAMWAPSGSDSLAEDWYVLD